MTDHKILQEAANRRERLHKGQVVIRELCKNFWYVGLVGEDEMAIEFDLDIDLSDRPWGDGRVDFPTTIGTVDVKTFTTPIDLLVEVGHESADIFVMAGYDRNSDRGWLIGWAWKNEVLVAPTKVLRQNAQGEDIVNHYINNRNLHPIQELHELGLARVVRKEVDIGSIIYAI